jgi:AraC family transcriptional regulator, regulatory protein of adaptative response / methylated-DNA-[protein]-cysteine methyltransferase
MLDEQQLWTAVRDRDARWDDVFVYAVRSTGIYCRPTCPSRRPRRSGVSFFAIPDAAERAGYRACRRCHPRERVPAAVDRVRKACAVLASRLDETPPLAALARIVGGNPHHLLRTFKQSLGVSPREYADACRVGCLKERLRAGGGVAAATYDAGYGSGSRIYERSSAKLGMTPAAYARGGKGEHVEFVTVSSPLGRLLVAATTRGVCAVKIGDSDRALERDLRREYPSAAIARGNAPLDGYVRRIVASLEPGAPDPRLPTDVRATAFQRQVWRELQRIPKGETRSYRDVAQRIGRPAAARAVARACATNPTALIVPCHRVVRETGDAGGYAWGVQRKRRLLATEATEATEKHRRTQKDTGEIHAARR